MGLICYLFLFTDALADTFYSIGVVMSLCQLFTVLELFHIADGIDKSWILPRLFQVGATPLVFLFKVKVDKNEARVCGWVLIWVCLHSRWWRGIFCCSL